ncbi:MAG: DUF2182 domain-containing protein [Xanthomonadales bacterium]|nr:DUF2182 domain-containing protein [Xanthomonadales bacterium]
MTARERARRHIAGVALLLSTAAWALYLTQAAPSSASAFCWGSAATGAWPSLQSVLQVYPPQGLAADWLLMLVAMMLPTLVAPLLHVHQRSFRHRRSRAIALFVFGYFSVWMLAGVALILLQLSTHVSAPGSHWPAAIAALLALVWQCSPAKQLCLNRSHQHDALAAFGGCADRDALGFGLKHGLWCVGSCWALMLMPLLITAGHTAAMLAATVVMSAERLEGPRPLQWRLRGLGKLCRIVAARLPRSPSARPAEPRARATAVP